MILSLICTLPYHCVRYFVLSVWTYLCSQLLPSFMFYGSSQAGIILNFVSHMTAIKCKKMVVALKQVVNAYAFQWSIFIIHMPYVLIYLLIYHNLFVKSFLLHVLVKALSVILLVFWSINSSSNQLLTLPNPIKRL